MASTTPLAGEAMDTLKMKIFMLKKENTEESTKLAAAEKAKSKADERITAAEKKIKDLSKQIHARKLLLDENTDKLVRSSALASRKEEATVGAREEIRAATAREMQLKAEVERVTVALPATQSMLCSASERADRQLSEVKKLEIRAMLTDQTIEEMEQQLADAHNMSGTTLAKAEDMAKKLSLRTVELGRGEDRAEAASVRLDTVNGDLRQADRKMAGLQFSLEERAHIESKYKKQLTCLQKKLANAEQRSGRDEETLNKLKEEKMNYVCNLQRESKTWSNTVYLSRMEIIGLRRRAKEEKQKNKK